MQNLNNIFINFTDNWIINKSIYLTKNKIKINYGELINIKKDIINNNLQTEFFNTNSVHIGNKRISKNKKKIQKKNKDKLLNYCYLYNENYIRFSFLFKNINIIYDEYIYSINSHLKVSISFLKKKYTKQYLSIIFISYIKKNKNP